MNSSVSKTDLKHRLTQRFFIRLHMTLILLGVLATGFIASKVFLSLGLTSMLARYPLVLLISYGSFFALIRMWLWYVSSDRDHKVVRESAFDLVDVPLSFPQVSRQSSQTGWPGSFGGGGRFRGAGAGGRWEPEDSVPVAVPGVSSVSPQSSLVDTCSKRSFLNWDSMDFDDIIVLVVLGILVLVILGVGSYIVFQAPAILSEVAFEALLASSLVKASQKMHRLGWVGSVFKATAIPFLLVLIATLIFAIVAANYCPEATKLADVLRGCGETSLN